MRAPRPDPGQDGFLLANARQQRPSKPRAGAPQAILPASQPARTVEYQQTNPTFNATLVVKPYANNLEQYLTTGDILFVQHGGVDVTRGTLANRRMPPVVTNNLQMLNTQLLRKDLNEAKTKELVKTYSFYGVLEHTMQLNGDSTMRRACDRVLSVNVRGRSVRTRNLWPNSSALDVVGFAFAAIFQDSPSANKWLPTNFKPLYVACDENGRILPKAEIVAASIGQPLCNILNTVPTNATERRAYCVAEHEALEKLNKNVDKFMVVPVNFTHYSDKEQLAEMISENLAWPVGVISDCFHMPPSSTADVTPALTLLDQRLGATPGVPQCELFIRVS